MVEFWRRHRLFVIGIVVVVAATALMLFFSRDAGFQVGDVTIRPRAVVDPERTYELTVWEEAIIIPWAAKTQSETVMDGIRTFQERYPNVAVSYSIIEPEEVREKLAEALAKGVPPDVYATAQGAVWHPAYTVPASPYLDLWEKEKNRESAPENWRPLSVAAAMLTSGDTLWGWPRGLWWYAWLAPAVATTGSPVADVLDVLFLEQWMARAGAPAYVDGEGRLLWTEGRLLEQARRMRAAAQAGLLPAPRDAARLARNRVEPLVMKTASAAGPVGPHLAQAVFRMAPGDFTLAPMPSALFGEAAAPSSGPPDGRNGSPSPGTAEAESIVLDVSAYFVFRHDSYEGDAHTRLAAELAAHLADHTERWLVQSLGLLPVRPSGETEWDEEAPLDEQSKQLLRRAAGEGAAYASFVGTAARDAFRTAVRPYWLQFWDEGGDPATFAADAAAALQQLITPESPTK